MIRRDGLPRPAGIGLRLARGCGLRGSGRNGAGRGRLGEQQYGAFADSNASGRGEPDPTGMRDRAVVDFDRFFVGCVNRVPAGAEDDAELMLGDRRIRQREMILRAATDMNQLLHDLKRLATVRAARHGQPGGQFLRIVRGRAHVWLCQRFAVFVRGEIEGAGFPGRTEGRVWMVTS